MNLLAMALIMGLAMLFMHGQGHGPSAPAANHHAEGAAGSPPSKSDAPGPAHKHGESCRGSNPDHPRAGESNPPPSAPPSE